MIARPQVWLWLCASMVAGCVVNRPNLTAEVFRCTAASDCLDGWVCADMSVLGDDVCRPACDPQRASETCPNGFCTSLGACFDRCEIGSDGSILHACTAGLTCIRRNPRSGEGLCLPAEGCSVTSDCAGSHRDCVNEAFGLPPSVPGTTFSTDRLYCIDTPEGENMNRCPDGSFAGGPGACIPSCDQPTDHCPPVLTCLRGLGTLFGATGRSACYPGVLGMPCVDDSGCVDGSCLPLAGGGRACTVRCEDAGPLGCDRYDGGHPLGRGLGGLDFSCDASGVCAAVGAVGAPCTEGLPCQSPLVCSNNGAGVCTTECMQKSDCIIASLTDRLRDDVYCAHTPLGLRLCLAQRPLGLSCSEADECSTGYCTEGACVAAPF